MNHGGATVLRFARKHRILVREERGVGDFVVDNTLLVSLAREDPLDLELIDAQQSTFHSDRHRTLEQDAAFGIHQIVDMALHARSPTISDTTTAVMGVDDLTARSSRVASRRIPPSHPYEDGDLRAVTTGPTFAKLVAESFAPIRGRAVGIVGTLLRMLGAWQTTGGPTAGPNRRRARRAPVQWLAGSAACAVESSHDRSRIDAGPSRVREAREDEREDEPGSPRSGGRSCVQ